MSLTGATLVAWTGVYGYVALYYGALHSLGREQTEHRVFAALCACLGVFSFASGFTMDAHEPAWAELPQTVQMVGSMAALGFFVDFALRLAEARRERVAALAYAWAILGLSAAMARLFFDPAFAEATYDWGLSTPADRAIAELTPVGAVFLAGGLLFACYAAYRLVLAARVRRDLRVPAVATVLGVAGALVDLAARIFDFTGVHIASHTTLLPVLGFSYALVARLTKVDAQLADRTEELAQSYDYLRQAQEELVKKEQLATVGELSAVIAHEVRNPLAILKNAVSGLRRSELRPEDRETLLTILDDETDRLNRLVNDLLAYAKPISPEPGIVDLRNLVGHAVELAAAGSRDISQIEIELELDREVGLVEGDEALLRHALINIVDNALQAMVLGGTLTVSCHEAELNGSPAVAVEVHDTGEGMDTLVRSRARDPFFTTRQTGTGLGLAIVDRVARAHGGRVDFDSRHGQGTTVSLVIPRERSTVPPTAS